ncbi:MAG TPA: TrkA family potassium uptake protein [Chloroflexota bacterium]|nr:TrkA family potassium uptake protein [Chloroflexota bacterium]
MYIIVVGAGKVGYYLTKSLLSEGEEVLVIEKDLAKAEAIINYLDGTAVHGDGAEATTLSEAGVERADVVVAVTGHDEDNLVICQVAKHRFKVPKTIARVNNPKNRSVFGKLGIDATVSATDLLLSLLQQEIPSHPIVHLLTLEEGGAEVVELELHSEAALIGKRCSEVELPGHSVLAAIVQGDHAAVPSPDTELQVGDRLVIVTSTQNETALRGLCLGHAPVPAR